MRMGKTLDDTELDAAMHKIDTDGSGEIEFGAGLLTFSTTIQPPYNHHTATIQSTKDGPPS